MISFNQKETSLLEDQKKQEEICVKKYQGFAQQAQDPQLKQLFQTLAQQEQSHLDSINQMLSGQLPSMSGQNQQPPQNGQQAQSGGQPQFSNQLAFPPIQMGSSAQNDKDMCEDLLSTEKYVSSAYNTAIFEFRDANVRQALSHIQKEEQQHGQQLFAYMSAHGMCNAQ